MKLSEVIANNTKPSCIGKYIQPGDLCCAWGAVLEIDFPI